MPRSIPATADAESTGAVPRSADRGVGSGARVAPRSWLRTDAPRQDLSGEWDFRFGRTPEALEEAPWGTITVPSHWVLGHDGAYGEPIYTNIRYPFPVEPPHVPDENPTGDYRRTFEPPADWLDGERFHGVRLRFDGVESAYEVRLNGRFVGTGTGSRLAQEFDVAAALRPGSNELQVRVQQWSAGSYLEDQDQWWLPGIFREVTLEARPAGGIEDLWLRTSWQEGHGGLDPEIRAGADAFPIRLTIPELGLDVTWSGPDEVRPLTVAGAEPWSSEQPRLYPATIAARGETVTQRIGFRTVEIVGDLFLVNGRRLVFHGMNRHEAHPDRGRVFDEAHARADLARMKRFNVNAIRTSHYPPHPRLLDLADELGLWVVLENDLETHGFEEGGWVANPSDDPAWHAAYLDRIERTFERDKNHASIVMWSLGNEAGTGANLAATAAWLHDRDAGRPVHYEGDHTGAYTDVYSRMYATPAELISIGGDGTASLLGCTPAESARQRSKPFLLCEYAHAMGNGPGGLGLYEELFDRFPRLHGGFIWEWRDHGIRRTAPDGSDYFAYGGDFGEVIHDGNFVMDGMVLSDDVPTPGLHEFAAVAAPVRLTVGAGELRVENRRHSAGTGDLALRWRVEDDGRPVASGELPAAAVAAGTTANVPFGPELSGLMGSVGLPAPTPAGERWLTVEAVLRAATPWAPAGHVVSQAQGRVQAQSPARLAPLPTGRGGSVPPRPGDGARMPDDVVFDGHGSLRRLFGLEVSGPQLALFRAPTDNDAIAGGPSYDGADPLAGRGEGVTAPPHAQRWREAGLDRLTARVEELASDDGSLRVRTRWAPAAGRDAVWLDAHWEAHPDGVLLTLRIDPSRGWNTIWPRIGVRFELPAAIDGAEWFGLGPLENYPDSLAAARVGRFRAGLDELNVRYARPQETGHRGELRALSLTAGEQERVRIEAFPDERGRRPGFTLSPHTAEQIAAARHPFELPPVTHTQLYLDAAQNGLGSRACGIDVWPSAALRPEARTLRLLLHRTAATAR
ncbi:MAG TPA: glycoside hydrolase family 2 TIM barrel-domain containing protein [Gryllotalpicola sp.]